MPKIAPKKAPAKKPNKTTFTLTSNQVHALFGSVVFATDSSDSRYALGSVLFNGDAKGLTTVATDGRHMAMFEGKDYAGFKDGFEVLISAKDVRALLNLLPSPTKSSSVTVTLGKTKISFALIKGRYGNERKCFGEYQLVEGKFPRWREGIPNSQYNEVASTIKGIAENLLEFLPTSDKQSTEGWDFDCKFRVFTKPPVANSNWLSEAIKVTGEMSLRFNVDLLASWLTALPGSIAVTINLFDHYTAIYCTAENGASYILMPIRKD